MSTDRIKKNAALLALVISIAATGCNGNVTSATASIKNGTNGMAVNISEESETAETDDTENSSYEAIENKKDGEHAILADGENASYSRVRVSKTGEAEGDEADFYGDNSAIFATNGATLDLNNIEVNTNGTHANAVFSYGEGTTVNISDSVINTEGNCSGGLMTTGGGTMNAENLTIHTTGNSSAAIRSDRGGGTVNVTGGTYSTDGTGSPAIYSTADITVSDAELTSTASEGIVVEGKNSVALNNVTITADNNKRNSDKADNFKAVMIYQSMSGDADEGKAEFTMNGGSITNMNGDVFFVNNTVADIHLSKADIVNNGDGAFLKAAAAGWGNEGSNGGKVNLYTEEQKIDGDITVDDISILNFYLSDNSEFQGSINEEGKSGDVYVELTNGSKWILTGDSYISSLTCDQDSIDLNGHKLYVDGTEYAEGTLYSGESIEIKVESSGMNGQGKPGTPPDGKPGDGNTPPQGKPGDGGNPPEKPGDSGNPPEKPGDGNTPPQGKPGEFDNSTDKDSN